MPTLSNILSHLADALREYDVLLAPSAMGEAPEGLDSTGDPVFGAGWTVLHGPAVTVPVFKGPRGLPIGAQIIGPPGKDGPTLQCAECVTDLK